MLPQMSWYTGSAKHYCSKAFQDLGVEEHALDKPSIKNLYTAVGALGQSTCDILGSQRGGHSRRHCYAES